MAITDPRVITHSNQKSRPFADLLVSAYQSALKIIGEWNAQGLAALTPNTSAVLQDSAAPNGVDATGGDGRPIVHGTDLNNQITRATDFKNWYEGSVGVSANDGSKAVGNTIQAISVNGRAIY